MTTETPDPLAALVPLTPEDFPMALGTKVAVFRKGVLLGMAYVGDSTVFKTHVFHADSPHESEESFSIADLRHWPYDNRRVFAYTPEAAALIAEQDRLSALRRQVAEAAEACADPVLLSVALEVLEK